MQGQTYDYVIVGAGSAGCVLANRLSARADLNVLLLEAGGPDSSLYIHMPAGVARLIGNREVDWRYQTEPEPELADRRLVWPRGRVLGGSSSINAMCYTRGHRLDYDEWAELGNPGWDYASVLPYFRKSEDQARGANDYHGVGGPLHVEDLRYRNPLSAIFVEAGVELGFNRNLDFNGPVQEGVGFFQVTQREGRRCSAAAAYLRPAERRANLTILTGTLARRVRFEAGRAVGVEYQRDGTEAFARAEREVIVAAGSIGSPQLLMLSGIGDPDALRALEIPVIAERAEVGRNLQDHLDFCTVRQCTRTVTYDFNKVQELVVGLRYLLTRSGPGASNIAEAGGFVRTHLATDERPDVQFHFIPARIEARRRKDMQAHGYTLHACHLRPASRGFITLRSKDPEDPPCIHARYLTEPRDLDVLLEGVRLSRDILHSRPFTPFCGTELSPGDAATTRAEIENVVRRKAQTIYHPVGTCRMGSDADSVVDPQLRVRGVQGLRVIDASVMPTLIGGNTNAPTIMIAEKAADILLSQ